MRHKLVFPALLAVASLALVAEDLAPGEYRDRRTASGNFQYSLLIPDAYAADPTATFPIVYGFSGLIRQMHPWAKRNGVIIFEVGENQEGGQEMFTAITATAEQTLRVHPCLRFSAGMSAAGQRAYKMAAAMGDKHAGVLCCAHSGATSGLPPVLPKYMCVAFNHGEADDVHPIHFTRESIEAVKANGNPVNWHFHPEGHNDGPYDESAKLLTWMLWTARLTHPKISAAERKTYQEMLTQRIAELSAQPPAARIAEIDGLLTIPGIRTGPSGKGLLEALVTAHYDRAHALGTPREQHQGLSELTLLPELNGQKIAKTVADELKEMRKDPEIKKEFQAWQALQGLRQQEAKLGTARAKGPLEDLAKAYHALGKAFSGTLAAEEADAGAKRLAERAARK